MFTFSVRPRTYLIYIEVAKVGSSFHDILSHLPTRLGSLPLSDHLRNTEYLLGTGGSKYSEE